MSKGNFKDTIDRPKSLQKMGLVDDFRIYLGFETSGHKWYEKDPYWILGQHVKIVDTKKRPWLVEDRGFLEVNQI